MLKKLLFVLLVVLKCFTVNAQSICGTDLLHEQRLRTDVKFRNQIDAANLKVQQYIESGKLMNMRTAGAIYTIPVVVHVIHTGDDVGTIYNPSNAQILGAIDYLNRVFNGTEPGTKGAGEIQIQFKLASTAPDGSCSMGIHRVDASNLPAYVENGVNVSMANGISDTELKSLARWDVANYYNIYVVNKIDGGESGIVGYAYLPGDGFNTLFGTVLIADQMRLGEKTLPHEVGHTLGLYHTFQGYTDSSCPPQGSCDATGDLVCDTDPVTPSYICRTGENGCTGAPYNEYTEENYMSYSSCYTLFTAGQKERMLAAMMLGGLKTLVSSNNPALIRCAYNTGCPGIMLESNVGCNLISGEIVQRQNPSTIPRVPCDPSSGQVNSDVWYSFVAQADSHRLLIDASESKLQPAVAVYESCSVEQNPIVCRISDLPGRSSDVVLNSLIVGKTYLVRVYNVNSEVNEGGFKICITHPCVAPGAPKDIRVVAKGPNRLDITWEQGLPTSDDIFYEVVAGTTTSVTYGTGFIQASQKGRSVIWRYLNCESEYYIRIRARNSCNNMTSAYTTSGPVVTGSCNDCVTPGAPVDLVSTVINQNAARFNWAPGTPYGSELISYRWVVGLSDTVTYGNGIDQGVVYDFPASASTTQLQCGTTNYFRVFAYSRCNQTSSAYSTSAPFTTSTCSSCVTPGKPVLVAASATGQNTASLSWASSLPTGSGTVTYFWVVGIDSSVTFGNGIDQGSTTATWASTSALSCSSKYYLRVYAYTSCNQSISEYGTSSAFVTPGCTPLCITPGAPVNLVGAANGQHSAILSWSAGTTLGSDPVMYHWVVGTSPTVTYGNGTIQGGTTDTSFYVNNLNCGTTYYLRVYARTLCNGTSSDYSTSLPFSTKVCGVSCTTPAAPRDVASAAIAQTYAILSWSAGSPAGSNTITYYWVVGTSPTVTYGNGVAQGQTSETAVSTGALSCGTTYYLRVYAKTSCDNTQSPYATSQPFTTSSCAPACVPPASPVNVSGNSTSETSATLSWQPGSPAGPDTITYYWVVGTSPTVTYGNGVAQGHTTETSVNIGALSCGTTYYLRVYAQTSCNQSISGYSTSPPFTTASCEINCETPAPPLNVTGATTSETSATLSWQPGSPAGSDTLTYYWVVGTSPTVTYGNGVAQGQTTATSVNIGALSCGTTYYLRVYEKTSCDNTQSTYATSQPFTTSACAPACVTPGLPIKVTPTVTGENSAKFTWSAGTPAGSGSITYYWVVGKTTNVVYGQGIDQGITTDTTGLTNLLECETTYYLRVFASTDCDQSQSPYSTSGAFTTAQCPCVTPGAPMNIQLTVTSANTATVSWEAGNPNGKEITYYWAVGREATVQYDKGAQVWGVTASKSITIPSLTCGEDYYFSVMALAGCDSSKSAYALYGPFQTDCAHPCHTAGVPTNLHAHATGENSVRLTWNAGEPGSASNAYLWYVAERPEDLWMNAIASGATTSTAENVSGLTCGKKYYFRVFAITLCNNTASSSAISSAFFTMGCPGNCETPGAPVYPSGKFIDSTTAVLTWYSGLPAGSATVTYRWVVGTTPNVVYGQGVAQGSTTENSITTQALSCGTTFYLRVFAESACNQNATAYATSDAFSNTCSPCTTPAAPENVSCTATGATTANLTWQAVSQAGNSSITYYWVVGSTPTVTYDQGVMKGSTTSTTVALANLNCGQIYYSRVYAKADCNQAGSDYGSSVAWTTDYNSCVTSVPTIPGLQDVQVMPNPNSGAFYVKLSLANRKDVQFTLTDLTGRNVFISPNYSVSGSITKRIDSSAVSAGVYLLKIRIGNQFIFRKIVIQR